MILLLDNYDSFTYNLSDYIQQLGEECVVYRNDQITVEQIEKLNPEAMVISPGPCTPVESGITMKMIEHFINKKPLLGICLGYQAIGQFLGADLVKAYLPMHGKTSLITHNDDIFKDVPQPVQVMRYHSLVLEHLERTPLKVVARTDRDEPMAFRHRTLPVYGLQFHPESILTEYGLQMLRNWVKIIRQ